MNCVFIDTGKDRILIETGIGEKWSEKEVAMYGINRGRSFAESLEAITGCTPGRHHDRRKHAPSFRPRRRQYEWIADTLVRNSAIQKRTLPLSRVPSSNMHRLRTNATVPAIFRRTGCRLKKAGSSN
jgi:hypothetical protein